MRNLLLPDQITYHDVNELRVALLILKSQPIFNRQLILNFFYSSLSLSPSYFNKREHRDYNLFSLLIERNSFVTFPSSYKYVLRGS